MQSGAHGKVRMYAIADNLNDKALAQFLRKINRRENRCFETEDICVYFCIKIFSK